MFTSIVVTAFRSTEYTPAIAAQWITKRKQFVQRHAVGDERVELLARRLQRREDHQVVADLIVLADGAHRHAEELVAAVEVEDRDRLEPALFEREIRELRRFAAPEDG